MDIPVNRKELVAIEYPGTVKNVSKLMEQLGGSARLNATFKNPLKRLELFFRPGDPFSKPCHGDKFNTTSFMMEIIKRTKKSTGEVTYELKYHGSLKSIYRFRSMCDFQLLPVTHNKDTGRNESLLSKLVPSELHLSDWLEKDVPLFITPLVYSRFDVPQSGYVELNKPKTSLEASSPSADTQPITHNRRKRNTYSVVQSFENADTPKQPMEEVVNLLQHSIELGIKDKLEALFAERPVWTKTALSSIIECDKVRVKHALTSTAYYCSNGPWRTLWVKFGYDPRKDPTAKIYQTMDFRIPANIKIEEGIYNRKRAAEFYMPKPKSAGQKMTSRIPIIETISNFAEDGSLQKKSGDSMEEHPYYMLIPGRIPCSRQCYFQLCDILYEDVQRLVHRNDGHEQYCHEKEGWCDTGVMDKCREIILRDIKETAQRLEQETEE